MMRDVAGRIPNPDRRQQVKDFYRRRGAKRPFRPAWKQLRDHEREVSAAHSDAIQEDLGRMAA